MQLSWIFLVLRSTATRAITISTAIFRTNFHQKWFNCEFPLFCPFTVSWVHGWSKHSLLIFFDAEIFMEILLLEEYLIQYLRWMIWKHCTNFNLHCTLNISVSFIRSLLLFALITRIHILLNGRNVGKNHLNGQLTDMFSQLPKLSTL